MATQCVNKKDSLATVLWRTKTERNRLQELRRSDQNDLRHADDNSLIGAITDQFAQPLAYRRNQETILHCIFIEVALSDQILIGRFMQADGPPDISFQRVHCFTLDCC